MVTSKIIILILHYIILTIMKPQVVEINRYFVGNTSFGIIFYEVGFKFQVFLATAFYLFEMQPSILENKLSTQIYILVAYCFMCLLIKANNHTRGLIKQSIEQNKDEITEEQTKNIITLFKLNYLQEGLELFLSITIGYSLFLLLST